jgi:molybdopterin-guanine dinucleotide biosynthesis protein A
MGGSKATAQLCGRPLISYPLAALSLAVKDVAIVAKADTELPTSPGVSVWVEPQLPRHPLVGIIEALGLAGGRPVLVCAADFPFVSAELLRLIANTDPAGTPAVIASSDGATQPLLGCYQPRALQLLGGASQTAPLCPLRETIEAIGPSLFEVEDPEEVFNVNAPDDLLLAAAMLDRRARRAPAGGEGAA